MSLQSNRIHVTPNEALSHLRQYQKEEKTYFEDIGIRTGLKFKPFIEWAGYECTVTSAPGIGLFFSYFRYRNCTPLIGKEGQA